jgi:hypothetical protein
MQISLLHTLARQAMDCASKMEKAGAHYERRISGNPSYLEQPHPR